MSRDGKLRPDTSEALRFLNIIAPNTPRCLVAIHEGKPPTSAQFKPFDLDGPASFIERHNTTGGNIYITPGVVDDNYEFGKARKPGDADLTYARAVFADIDVNPEKPETRKHRDSIMGRIESGDLPQPTLVVETGDSKGIHIWYALEELATKSELEDLRSIGVSLRDTVNGDNVQAPSHLMRVPGCVNYPTAKKAAAGRKPALARIILETSRLYSTKRLERHFPPTTERKPKEREQTTGNTRRELKDRLTKAGVFDLRSLDDYLENKPDLEKKLDAARDADEFLDDMLQRGKPAISDYNEINGTHLDDTGSGLMMSLAVRLREHRFNNDEEIAALVHLSDTGSHEKSNYEHEIAGAVLSSRRFQATNGEHFIPKDAVIDDTTDRKQAKLKALISKVKEALTQRAHFDPVKLVPPRRLLMPHYALGTYSVIAAPGGFGKSALSMVEAVSIHLGEDLFGRTDEFGLNMKIVQRNALIINYEDDEHELTRRLQAISQHYKIKHSRIDSIKRISMRGASAFLGGHPTSLMVQQGNDRCVENMAVTNALREFCTDNKIGAVIIDPAGMALGVDLNSPMMVQYAAEAINKFADDIDAAIMFVAHTRKGGSGESTDTSVNSIRGAAALVDHARSARVLLRMTPKEAVKAGLEEWQWRSHVRIDEENAKQNLTLPANERTTWLKLRGVTVKTLDVPEFGSSSEIQVMTPTQTPVQMEVGRVIEKLATVEPDQIGKILKLIDDGMNRNEKSKPGTRALDAILQVMSLSDDNKADVIAAKSLLKKLLADKTIVVEKRRDENRNTRDFYTRGPLVPRDDSDET